MSYIQNKPLPKTEGFLKINIMSIENGERSHRRFLGSRQHVEHRSVHPSCFCQMKPSSENSTPTHKRYVCIFEGCNEGRWERKI